MHLKGLQAPVPVPGCAAACHARTHTRSVCDPHTWLHAGAELALLLDARDVEVHVKTDVASGLHPLPQQLIRARPPQLRPLVTLHRNGRGRGHAITGRGDWLAGSKARGVRRAPSVQGRSAAGPCRPVQASRRAGRHAQKGCKRAMQSAGRPTLAGCCLPHPLTKRMRCSDCAYTTASLRFPPLTSHSLTHSLARKHARMRARNTRAHTWARIHVKDATRSRSPASPPPAFPASPGRPAPGRPRA